MNKTEKEIRSQFSALAKTVKLMTSKKDEIRSFFAETSPSSIIVIGCGSSFQIGESIAMSARLKTGVSSVAVPGGDLLLNDTEYAPLFSGSPLMFAITRSGSTSEILYAVQRLKVKYPKLKLVCISCVAGSEIGAMSDYEIALPWAFDESVCQTRSVTNLYAAALLFLASVAGSESIYDSYRLLSQYGDVYINSIDGALKEIGAYDFSSVAMLCDGEGYGLAEEAALAFNEIAYLPSMCKHVLDIRHGPIVLFNSKTLVVIKLGTNGLDYSLSLIEDIQKRGAKVIVVSEEALPQIPGVLTQISFGQKLDSTASAVLILPVAQLLAYYHALRIGADPDKPDGLDAWIKL